MGLRWQIPGLECWGPPFCLNPIPRQGLHFSPRPVRLLPLGKAPLRATYLVPGCPPHTPFLRVIRAGGSRGRRPPRILTRGLPLPGLVPRAGVLPRFGLCQTFLGFPGSRAHGRERSAGEFLRVQDVQDREGDLVVGRSRFGPAVLPCQHARRPRARGRRRGVRDGRARVCLRQWLGRSSPGGRRVGAAK